MKQFMKQLAALGLIFCLLAGMVACADSGSTQDPTAQTTAATEATTAPTEPASYYDEVNKEWVITDVAGLELLREHPGDNFRIAAEIDCGGMEWTPIEEFSGRISGLWGGKFNHTISNLQLRNGSLGFFRNLSGTVEDLNFENITLDASGDSGFLAVNFTGTVTDVDGIDINISCSDEGVTLGGMFAYANGTVENCTVSGGVFASVFGTDNRIGGLAGVCEGMYDSVIVRTFVTVAASEGSGYVGGIGGECKNVIMNKMDFSGYFKLDTMDAPYYFGTLAGSFDGTVTDFYSAARDMALTGSALTSESLYCGTQTADSSITECWVRDVSSIDEHLPARELSMRKEAVEYMYTTCTIPWTPTKDMSHSDSCASHHVQNYKAGVTYFGQPYTHFCSSLERFESALNPDGTVLDTIPSEGWERFMGNDCADAVYWSWAQFSPSITYTLTHNMICTNGTVQVGEYELANHEATADTCALNGENVMYEAYAQVKMGDGLLFSPGHVRMAAEAAYVYRNEDGTINPEKSFIYIHEQGATMKVEEHFSTCSVNKKVTFAKLFKGNYIPVTIPEYAQGAAPEAVVTVDTQTDSFNNFFDGTITSNYRINWVTIRLFDDAGSQILENTLYPTSSDHNDTFSLTLLSNTVRRSDLESGKQYRIAVLVGVANSLEVCARELTFTAP